LAKSLKHFCQYISLNRGLTPVWEKSNSHSVGACREL